jgi:hypothetical protein
MVHNRWVLLAVVEVGVSTLTGGWGASQLVGGWTRAEALAAAGADALAGSAALAAVQRADGTPLHPGPRHCTPPHPAYSELPPVPLPAAQAWRGGSSRGTHRSCDSRPCPAARRPRWSCSCTSRGRCWWCGCWCRWWRRRLTRLAMPGESSEGSACWERALR